MECIKYLFTLVVKYESLPSCFKIGIIVSIPKGDKDRCKQNNYRGITLMPAIAKLFEKIIMNRVGVWAKENSIIHQMQDNDQKHCSSLHTAWLVRESITDNLEKGKNVHVAPLDIKKLLIPYPISVDFSYCLYKTSLNSTHHHLFYISKIPLS